MGQYRVRLEGRLHTYSGGALKGERERNKADGIRVKERHNHPVWSPPKTKREKENVEAKKRAQPPRSIGVLIQLAGLSN